MNEIIVLKIIISITLIILISLLILLFKINEGIILIQNELRYSRKEIEERAKFVNRTISESSFRIMETLNEINKKNNEKDR